MKNNLKEELCKVNSPEGEVRRFILGHRLSTQKVRKLAPEMCTRNRNVVPYGYENLAQKKCRRNHRIEASEE